MKNLLTIIFILFILINTYSQNISDLNGQTINGCGGATLYDSGGAGGEYSNNETQSVTFCSGTTDCIELSFVSFDLESGWDYLNIYDGNSISATQIAHLDGNAIPGNVTSSNGCITIQIVSDGGVVADGFEINISCTANCYVPPPPPTNIDPCTSTSLTIDTVCNSILATTLGAANSAIADPTCASSYNGGDVWFSAVVPASGLLEVDLAIASPGLADAGIAIYTGADCNNITEYACNEPWSGMPSAQYVLSAAGLAGETVWIRVWELGNDNQGVFNICAWEPPPFFETDSTVYTPQQLVEDILVTGCLEALNTVYTGDPKAIGYFLNGSITGFESGVVMGCGPVSTVAGTSIDPDDLSYMTPLTNVENDLSSIAQQNGGSSDMYDVTTLEFDFKPSSDTTEFGFVFASEEYNGYECSDYNDVFAFFLSGPGITGPYNNNSINVALVPGTTTPITITTVNGPGSGNTCGAASYEQYYIDHPTMGPDFQVTGYTTPLTAILGGLVPCETYHITLAIADAGDGALNSFVFFDEASFSSGGDVSMGNNSDVGTVTDIYEGCENYWVFSRIDTTAEAMQDTVFIDLIVDGTATLGSDYTSSSTNLVMLPGETSDTLFYSALWDNVQENDEYIVFSLLNGCPCSLQATTDTIWIFDNFNLDPVISNDTLICGNSPVTVSVDINPLQDPTVVDYLWDDGSTGTSITVTTNVTETHWVNVSTTCQPDTTVEMTITIVPPIDPSFTISKDSICISEEIDVTFIGSTSVGSSFIWDFNAGTPINSNTEGPHTVSWSTSGIKTITLNINDNGCVNDTMLTLFVSPNPVITIVPTNNPCFGECSGQLLAQAQDSYTPYTYLWSNSQTVNPATNLCAGVYDVAIANRFGCLSTSSASITEPAELAFTLDSTAVQCYGGHDGTASITVNSGTPPYVYSWTGPNGYTSNTQSITDLYTGLYYVTATDSNGCEVLGNLSVPQPDTALTSIIDPIDINCYNASDGKILLSPVGGTAMYTFLWSNGVVTQNLIHIGPGTYDVTITDANGCIGYNTASVTQPTELINNSLTTNNNVCWGENSGGSITLDINGSVPPYNYTWSNGDNTAVADSLYAGIYGVTVNDAQNCQLVINNIEILEPGKLVVMFNNLPTMCIGQTEELISSVSGGTPLYTYQWNSGEITDRITISPTDTTIYSLTVTDANNCTAIVTKTINVYDPISISLVADALIVCPGDPVVLTTTAVGGNGNYTYTLNSSESISDVHTVHPNIDMSYSVVVTDNCGSPSDNALVNISTYPVPTLSLSSDILRGCQPLSVHFIEQSGNDSIQEYLWNFGDGNTANVDNPTHIYENWGVFDVSLQVTSYNGCKNSMIINNMIEVYKKPIAKFTANPQTVSIIKPEVRFYNISEDNVYNYWWFGDGTMSNIESPMHKYAAVPKFYEVKLVVETEHGCVDSIFTQIIVNNEYTFYAPSAFSPDGDGINDSFFVVGNGVNLDAFNLKIYNRWGEIIWETSDMNQAWDGKTKSGKYVQAGVYKWLVNYQDETGIEYQESGNVNVIR